VEKSSIGCDHRPSLVSGATIGSGRHRCVVERMHAWLAAFGKRRTRFKRRLDIHVALLSAACRIICLRTLDSFC
jgi:hypothetical protein